MLTNIYIPTLVTKYFKQLKMGNKILNFFYNDEMKIQGSNYFCNSRKNVKFTGLPENLANSVPEGVLKNKKIHAFCKMAEKNASLFDVSLALIMGTTLGAGGVLVSPFNKKEERQYMASQLIMNCAVSFLLSLIVYLPLSKGMQKLGNKALIKSAEKNIFPYKQGTKEFDSFNYLVNYGSRFIIAPIQSILIIKGITPLFKELFQKNNKQKAERGGEK